MTHTFKRRERARSRPHEPTTTAPSSYAAEVKRLAQTPSDVVRLAESRRDHKLDPVHLPTPALALALTKAEEKYVVANPQALFKPPPKPDDAPATPPADRSRWAKKHVREPSEMSKRLAACMDEKGMSQRALAAAADLGAGTLWQILNPKVGENPKPRALARIAAVLGVDADWLWTGQGERVAPDVAAAPEPLPTAPPKATAANPFPTAPPVNASAPPALTASDRRLLNAVAETQAAVAETLDSFGLTQAASMTRLAAELIRRATRP